MHPDLKDRVARVVLFILDVLEEVGSARNVPHPDDIRPTIRYLVDQFDGVPDSPQSATKSELNTFQQAKYALIAWVDDRLIHSKWPHAAIWKAGSLELAVYGSERRPWRFFEQAELALARNDLEALTVYQLCVALGFRGIYRNDRVKVRLNDPLPMTRARVEASVRTPILQGLANYGPSGDSHAILGIGPSDSRPVIESSAATQATWGTSPPELPPTLGEWSLKTFHVLGTRPDVSLLPRASLFQQALGKTRLLSEWAIVLVIGALVAATLLALGH